MYLSHTHTLMKEYSSEIYMYEKIWDFLMFAAVTCNKVGFFWYVYIYIYMQTYIHIYTYRVIMTDYTSSENVLTCVFFNSSHEGNLFEIVEIVKIANSIWRQTCFSKWRFLSLIVTQLQRWKTDIGQSNAAEKSFIVIVVFIFY